MKTRVYTVSSEALKQPRVRAHISKAREIATAVAATTGRDVTISRTLVEGPDTDIVVALMQLAHGEDLTDWEGFGRMIRSEGVEVHRATSQLAIAMDGPIPWQVVVEKLGAEDDEDE